jgi:hypothetical protein
MITLIGKLLLLLCVLVFFSTVGCKEKPGNPVAEYGNKLIESYQKSQNAAETANLDAIKKSLQQYRAEHEEYPRSLKDIENLAGVVIDPDRYDYNPQTGSVSLKSK